MKPNTLVIKGKRYQILHTINAAKTFCSGIVALSSHFTEMSVLLASGTSLAERYELVPADVPESGVVHDVYEIRYNGELVGYWDYPILPEQEQLDKRMAETLDRLLGFSEDLSRKDYASAVAENSERIKSSEGSYEKMNAVFGFSPERLAVYGERLGWLKTEYGQKSCSQVDTDFPVLEKSEVLDMGEVWKKSSVNAANVGEETRIRKNPELEGYYRQPISKEELEKHGCSMPKKGFSERIGYRLMKKGFLRGGPDDPARGNPLIDKKETPKLMHSVVTRGFRRKPQPEPETAQATPDEARETSAITRRIGRGFVRRTCATEASRKCDAPKQRMLFLPAIMDNYTIPKAAAPPGSMRIRRGFVYAHYG